ncbi:MULTISPECIES: PBP1A family penicillin-binding protein [Enterococcus]|uniref:PBP1A family penicillin-binding protein n=2 Tax=Enterococcus entomosocium TaxID=3034352 RepID=A0ABV3MG71_9ENTE|nr:PBP1A family penicillin-binding protein [Enterococcus casseliflavus]MDB1709174.1 PBP1A family penicillin-binding protein [Enterococcus casseliflavus]MDB1717461.1 PBP1A family penicillin-binding protein [Enterococcus casseliflavus]
MANESQSRTSRHDSKKGTAKKAPKPPKTKAKGKRSIGSILLKVFMGLFFLGCIGILSGMGLFWWYAKDAPALDETRLDSTVSSRFYASNGELITEFGSETREKITASEIPQLLEDAIVSVEDRRFYQHIGVDPIRIVGSALSNATTGGMQGGSTLTQQLIKLSFFSTSAEDQTLRRKAQEAWMAVRLEQTKSKQEILTYYINKVYMSNGVYGMQTAAMKFYGKPLAELDLAQTALIAGLPNAPSAFDPFAHPDNAKSRRDVVLGAMLENEKITQAEYDAAVAEDIQEGLQENPRENQEWKYFDNYFNEVIAEVKEKTGKDVYTDGLDIYTNVDIDAQKRLYDIVNSDDYVNYPDDKMQVAATLVDVNTGKVTAQIGARNVDDVLANNLAVNVARDFGSTVKPITDYGPAFQFLQDSTGRMILDEPYTYKGTDIPVYNWDRQYMGNITLRTALAESRNVPAVKLFDEVGADNIADFLSGLGIEYHTITQSNAISSNTDKLDGTKYGISSLKMAAAYAAFSNGGTYYEPQYVNKIVMQDGTEDEESFKVDGQEAMDDTTAYMVTDILKDVISVGTGTNAQIDGLYQAGKTGTSNYTDDQLAQLDTSNGAYPDITFAGYTPSYSLAVWTGYNDKMTPITDSSTHVASDVYRELMRYVSASVENTDWTMPDGLTRIGRELYLEGTYTQPSYSAPSSSSSSSYVEPTTPSTESSEETPSSTTESSSEVTPPVTTPDEDDSSSVVTPPASSQDPGSTTPSSSEENPSSPPDPPEPNDGNSE